MKNNFVIFDRLMGLNEYINLNRTNRFKGAKAKATEENYIRKCILIAKQKGTLKSTNKAIKVDIKWYEPNNKRDIDNISFAVKFILDSLVKEKIIVNDNQKYVKAITHEVLVDKNNARIEVNLCEIS